MWYMHKISALYRVENCHLVLRLTSVRNLDLIHDTSPNCHIHKMVQRNSTILSIISKDAKLSTNGNCTLGNKNNLLPESKAIISA